MSFIKSKLQTAINNNMKNTFKTLLFISLLCGVSGADETKSVMEGDSVTLQTDVTEILTDDKILWWFKVDVIARIIKGEIKFSEDVADGRFRGRLKLDNQTGSLTITNTRTIHSGEYKIQIISSNTGTTEKRFTLTVYESPSVIDPDRGEVKSVEVTEGKSVPLNTDINPRGDELIVWRFGDILIAKDDKENNKISLYPDERFKDRIHLDQTGSLIITDSRTTDTGEYKLKISSNNRDTKHKRFSLTVKVPPPPPPPPMSAAAKAGITVAGLLVAAAVTAVVVVVVIYYRRKISEQERLKDEQRTVLEMKGESVPLITDDAHIKTHDVNLYYGETLKAEIRRGEITRVKDDIRDRLELNHQTGSLIINNIRRTDAGIYQLKIIICTKEITYKRIILTVRGEVIRKTVMKGDSVSLSSDVPELQKDAEVELIFKNTVIAHKKQKDKKISLHQDAHDGKFKLNLKVDQQTGSLTITDFRMDQSGVYELKITSSRATVHKIFYVSFSDEEILKRVKEGDSVDLSSDVTELQEDAEIEWRFENAVIAEKKQEHKTISLRQDAHEEDFGGKLNVNQQTGSLTITDITMDQGGVYELNIINSRETVHKIFNVYFYGEYILNPVTEGDSGEYIINPVTEGNSTPSRSAAIDKENESVSLMMK